MPLVPLIISLSLCHLISPAQDNWPEYRGPNSNGSSAATGLPLTFSDTQNVKWKTEIHGRGWFTPVIWGDQIWMTTATPDGRKMFILCVDKTAGKVLCDNLLFENANVDPIADINSYASPSAVIEDGRVYAHFGSYGTACIDTKSFSVLWTRRDLIIRHSVGPGSSPILFENLLILTMDGTDEQYTIALNKRTGKEAWKTARRFDRPASDSDLENGHAERRKSFNTPVLNTFNGRTEMISPAASAVYGYDPRNGKELWRAAHGGYSNSFRTLVGDGVAYVDSGYDKADLFAVKLGGTGDISSSHILWKTNKNIPFKPSGVLVDGFLYVVNDGGILSCLDSKTGEQVWLERIGGHFSASPICADGRIYFFSEEGQVTVIKPGRKLEILAKNQLNDGFMASPAISGKAMFLRTKTHLYRVEK
jgi:outer membrane protein assembly factor BamB